MDGAAFPGGYFCLHLCVLQIHLIVPWRGLFTAVGKARRLPSGGDEDVAPVVTAGAAEMSVGEAVNDGVGVVVAAAAVPVSGIWPCVRAQLDHSKGVHRPGERVAVRICTHKRVHKWQK